MTKESIENMREILMPFVAKKLKEINYEGLGESDAKEFTQEFNEILDLAIKALEQEPKTGHWLKSRDCYGNNHFTCPFCEHDIATKSDTWKDNYCSNCGAKMEVDKENE